MFQKTLTFKTRLCAKLFCYESEFYLQENKKILFISIASPSTSLWNRGLGQLGDGLIWLFLYLRQDNTVRQQHHVCHGEMSYLPKHVLWELKNTFVFNKIYTSHFKINLQLLKWNTRKIMSYLPKHVLWELKNTFVFNKIYTSHFKINLQLLKWNTRKICVT